MLKLEPLFLESVHIETRRNATSLALLKKATRHRYRQAKMSRIAFSGFYFWVDCLSDLHNPRHLLVDWLSDFPPSDYS